MREGEKNSAHACAQTPTHVHIHTCEEYGGEREKCTRRICGGGGGGGGGSVCVLAAKLILVLVRGGCGSLYSFLSVVPRSRRGTRISLTSTVAGYKRGSCSHSSTVCECACVLILYI